MSSEFSAKPEIQLNPTVSQFPGGAVFQGIGSSSKGVESHFTAVGGEGFHLTERFAGHEIRHDCNDFFNG
ncbi:MAG: hypothetical protein HQ567_24615 [Candidatus Nealsonbacteria bacterium]|nr:hypothetical protein [Candidatus Nealsonbacteria bacterium]